MKSGLGTSLSPNPEHVSRNRFLREERQLVEKRICPFSSYRHPCHPWPCLPYVEARHCPGGLAKFPRESGECSCYAMMNDIRNLNQPSSRLRQTASLTWRPFEPNSLLDLKPVETCRPFNLHRWKSTGNFDLQLRIGPAGSNPFVHHHLSRDSFDNVWKCHLRQTSHAHG